MAMPPDVSGLPIVTPMALTDLDEIMRLERLCFREPWTRRMYITDLTENDLATYLVVRPPQQATAGLMPAILAYGGFWRMVDEAHIATVATHPDWRGCGLGIWLMLALLRAATAGGAVTSTLEVRTGNFTAQRMYEKLGYELVGMRHNYYRDGEDGLIMTLRPLLTDPAMRDRLAAAQLEALRRMQQCFGAA